MELRTVNTELAELRVKRNDENEPSIDWSLGIPFQRWSDDLGGFIERVGKDAEIDISEAFVANNHDTKEVLARQDNGAEFERRKSGIYYRAPIPPTTWGRDLAVQIERKNVRGNSWQFQIVNKENSPGEIWETEGGKNKRTLTRFKVFEVGPQTVPAYPATNISLRSALGLSDDFMPVLVRIMNKLPLSEADAKIVAELRGRLDRVAPNLGPEPQAREGQETPQARASQLRRRLRLLESKTRLIRSGYHGSNPEAATRGRRQAQGSRGA